jgi:hypothetical protein
MDNDSKLVLLRASSLQHPERVHPLFEELLQADVERAWEALVDGGTVQPSDFSFLISRMLNRVSGAHSNGRCDEQTLRGLQRAVFFTTYQACERVRSRLCEPRDQLAFEFERAA